MTDWGPTGELVYNRTYSRPKTDGSRETWPETVRRVVDGNLALVPERHQLPEEREDLIRLMEEFKVIPAGRQLWATGVRGRQYLYNCFVSGWGEKPSDHFEFTFMRLMEGGGVGANYSNHLLDAYPPVAQQMYLHIVCDPEHPDYEELKAQHLLSDKYVDDWEGCFQIEDSREGWAAALTDLIDTFYRVDVKHYNRVYDVSRVRASGSKLRTYGGYASGPVPLARMLHRVAKVLDAAADSVLVRNREDCRLSGMDAMEIDHAIAECVVAGGNRRSARMAIMHWADPQIDQFLSCKQDTGKHWTTNISVEIDDEFIRRANDDMADASEVLRNIATGMLRDGEPGIWNSSYSNEYEPNAVQATNPCGEIPLEPWEACNLGHVNLAAFVDERGELDEDRLTAAHILMTRFLIRSTFGDRNDPKQAEVMDRNRRIGLGHFGFAEFAHLLGHSYADADSLYMCELLTDLARTVDYEAVRFAHDLRIPVPVKKRTVAPTGTIAKMPGTSEGIHPIFAKHFLRRIRFSTVDPEQFATATEYAAKGYNVVPDIYADNTVVVEIPTEDIVYNKVAALYGEAEADRIVQSPDELKLSDMLAVQEMYQAFWADNAVSYTANIDPEKYTVQDIVDALMVHLDELKGVTLFPELSRPLSPYERLTKTEFEQYSNSTVEDSVDEECATGACPVR